MGRKRARDNAFKCIYQLGFEECNQIEDILRYCYEEKVEEQEELEQEDKPYEEEEKAYIKDTLTGVKEHLEEIDAMILSKLKNWSMSRIAKIDLAILRLAIYEITYRDDIPVKVTANEAVELAKTYGNNDSKSFVNGVIAKIIESKDESNG